jgi:hypothetical protein
MCSTKGGGWLRRIYGVDFSGAEKAGRKIWIASGTAESNGLRIEDCFRGEDLPGSRRHRAGCLEALRDFVRGQRAGAFGFDFPFGIPGHLVEDESWEGFVRGFPSRYGSPDIFRESCRKAAGPHEVRRETDRESHTPFSPYNLRIYKQTYFGIRDLLAPLVRENAVCVLPMQAPLAEKPWLLEICPASTLRELGKSRFPYRYKGKKGKHAQARAEILTALERHEGLTRLAPKIRAAILANPEGDALDSVIAALATHRALRNPRILKPLADSNPGAREGYVFV